MPENPSSQPAAASVEVPEPTAQERELTELRAQLKQFQRAGQILTAQVTTLQGQLDATLSKKSKLPSNIKLPPLDKYGGSKNEDLLAWLFQVNEQCTILQIEEDETRIVFAGTALTQNAKTWYRAMRLEGNVKTWDDFQISLKAHFYPVDPVKQARDQLHPLVQTGSVRDYTATFRHLIAIIGTMSEDEKLDRYIRGLKTRTRHDVELKEPDSFDEACRLAEMIDVSNDRAFGGFSSARAYPPPPPAPNQGPEPMDLNAVSDPQEKPRAPVTSEEKERRRREGLCFYCGSDKHKLDGCNLRKS
jgi:hypothetical protein